MSATVFVVDDDVSVRESLELLLRWAGWTPVLCESARAFLGHPRATVPSCVVLDVELPDVDGLELQRRLQDRVEMPVVFLTAHGDIPMTVRAMKAGATEFLTKPFSVDVLLDAVRHALAHSARVLDGVAEVRELRERHATLTRREREVMTWVVAGLPNKQVAAELGTSEITIKAHRGKVMLKMKADSLPDLVRMCARLEVPIPSSNRPGSEDVVQSADDDDDGTRTRREDR